MASTKNGLKMTNMSGTECPECGSRAATKQIHKELRECGHTLEVKELRICRLCVDEYTVSMSLGEYKQRGGERGRLNSTVEWLIDFVMFCIVITTVLIMVIGIVGAITIIGGAI
jgi:DNA-directed RNA polymerase subunit RPC12/RpoP